MNMKNEVKPTRYAQDKEIFQSYRTWYLSRYGTEPSSQQSLLCCDWGLFLLNNPPQKNA